MSSEPRNGLSRSGANGGAQAKLERAVAAYVDRLTSGERIDPLEILAAHPGDGHLILERLETFVRPGGPGDLGLPRRLGDYDLLRVLGRGGMGVVYEAWQHSLERRVALKLLPAGAAADRRAFLRFVREAQTAARLRHPGIVSVYGMGLEAETPWFAMEYVEGRTLAAVIAELREAKRRRAGGESPTVPAAFLDGDELDLAFYARVARSFAEVASGLRHAHECGVIHRDIKPSNLILDRSAAARAAAAGEDAGARDRLRILDFGLARIEGRESLSASGDLVGTPLYMSPEQARRQKVPIDHRTDLYSLGATLYELLTLAPPFQGRDHQDTLSRIIHEEPVPPHAIEPRVPRDLETIILKCLRKRPEDRYATAEALAQDLRRFARGQPIEARPQKGWEKSAAWLRRHRRKLAFGAALLALALALAWAGRRWRAAERSYRAATYAAGVRDAVERLHVGRFSLEAAAGRPGELLLPASGLLTPLRPEDFRRFLGGEGERLVHEAARDLERLAALVPGGRDAHYHLARALELLGDRGGAQRAVERALEIDPAFAPARALRAELEGHPLAPPALPSAGERGREDDWARWWLLARPGAGPAARLEAHDRLVAFARRRGEPFLGFSLEVYLSRGAARLMARNFAGAQRDFAVARHLAPGSLEPELLLGKAYYLAGEPEEARRMFERLYAGRGEEEGAALWIAAACIASREHADSLEWIEKLGEGALKDRLRAQALARLDRWREAREAAERALAAAPKSLGAHALLVWALMHELRPAETERTEEIIQRLLEASRQAVEAGPEEQELRFLRSMALAAIRRRLRELGRRYDMNGTKSSLRDLVSPAVLATALAAAGPIDAREVCHDFEADPNPPPGWLAPPCCPGELTPGGCEDIEGLAVVQVNPGWGLSLGTGPFAGDVRVQVRVSFCGTQGLWSMFLHFSPDGNSYYGGFQYRENRWYYRIAKWRSSRLEFTARAPVDFDPSQGVYDLEFASRGARLELRAWPAGTPRPETPQHFLDDSELREGYAGFSYLRGSGSGRGVISSICITELEEPTRSPPFRRGDCSGDGTLNISDAVRDLRFCFGGSGVPCAAACDTDGDGDPCTGVADGVRLLMYLFQGGEPPPPPFPECGTVEGEVDCDTPPPSCE